MPSELNRRTLFAAVAAFVVALAVVYALSSTGQASQGTGAPGSPAQPLDVASGIAGQSTLGEAEALPALVRRPKPKPPKEEAPAPEVTAPSAPATQAPVYQAPAQAAPVTPTPPATPPPVFSDSG